MAQKRYKQVSKELDSIKQRLANNYEKPITKKQQRENERNEAIGRLHEILKPGDTVYCILRHRSASGMSRRISFAVSGSYGILEIDWLVARALGDKLHKDSGIMVSGCGMDMGFHMVYNIGRTMFPKGFDCAGRERRCPSNDHSNGDRNYEPHNHSDGGYALRSRWL